MAYDGSAHDPHWGPADLDAVHAVVNLGPGAPAVFGQTVTADADLDEDETRELSENFVILGRSNELDEASAIGGGIGAEEPDTQA